MSTAAWTGVMVVLAASVAAATDHPEPARVLTLQTHIRTERLGWRASDPSFALPSVDPQSTGATLTVTGSSGMAAMDLPAAGWRAHADGTVLKFSAA